MAYEFNRFRVEPQRRRALREGQVIPVTPKVFDTLVLLIERRGEVLTKDEMLALLWPDTAVEENNLGQAISKLRQILGEAPGDNAYMTRRIVAALLLLALCATLISLALARRGRGAVDRITSVAVLSFKPLVPPDRDQALEFGIADILIRRLASINDVSVRSLGRVRRYADTSSNPLEAGRELGVDAVLDGHIHRSGERIRITARLVRVADERQLWSGQFDEDFRSVFDIQDSIARRVDEQLSPELDAGAKRGMTRRDTSDPVAYESYLRGRFFISPAQPLNAIRMFEEAVGRDPRFAVAHAGLADIYSRLPVATDGPSADVMARAKACGAGNCDRTGSRRGAHGTRVDRLLR